MYVCKCMYVYVQNLLVMKSFTHESIFILPSLRTEPYTVTAKHLVFQSRSQKTRNLFEDGDNGMMTSNSSASVCTVYTKAKNSEKKLKNGKLRYIKEC